ncbi:glutamate synthase large chain [Marssonina coronariae]|uniref:Glutamate synthase large chain n=1 Tax=Diplocarpon coronariae TaxID=2795749 RepID=A0A218Z8G1_9HELO|nr:glutamate synthase large chain [Marssonina coronariae]
MMGRVVFGNGNWGIGGWGLRFGIGGWGLRFGIGDLGFGYKVASSKSGRRRGGRIILARSPSTADWAAPCRPGEQAPARGPVLVPCWSRAVAELSRLGAALGPWGAGPSDGIVRRLARPFYPCHTQVSRSTRNDPWLSWSRWHRGGPTLPRVDQGLQLPRLVRMAKGVKGGEGGEGVKGVKGVKWAKRVKGQTGKRANHHVLSILSREEIPPLLDCPNANPRVSITSRPTCRAHPPIHPHPQNPDQGGRRHRLDGVGKTCTGLGDRVVCTCPDKGLAGLPARPVATLPTNPLTH